MNNHITFNAPRYLYIAIIFFLGLSILIVGGYTEWFTELPTLDENFKRTLAIIGMPFALCFFIYLLILERRSPNLIDIYPKDNSVFFDKDKISDVQNIKITQSAVGRYQVCIEKTKGKIIKTAHYYNCNHSFEELKNCFTGTMNTQILHSNSNRR